MKVVKFSEHLTKSYTIAHNTTGETAKIYLKYEPKVGMQVFLNSRIEYVGKIHGNTLYVGFQ